MFSKIINIFRIAELRNKLLFTIALLCVYRIGFYVPLPGVNAHAMYERVTGGADNGAFGMLSNYLSVFSGGDLTAGSIFGLGIMPYISASIILQLLGTVVPALEKLKKEGEPGMRKITEWTRYLTVAVCIIQASMYVGSGAGLILFDPVKGPYGAYHAIFPIFCVIILTAGSVFLMWLGEQIDHFGIGNGVSLIITAGIVSRMPVAIGYVIKHTSLKFTGSGSDTIGPGTLIFLIACFIFVVAGAIFLTQAQRRIPIQQAKHMRGRRVYGGAKQYLPLRVNHAGVMPIIFASSLMIFPAMGFRWLADNAHSSKSPDWWIGTTSFFTQHFSYGTYLYETSFCAMIFFFSYFWNTVQFQPKEMANQLRDYGSFIPGLRPGKRTADYLENVMTRVTYVGAAFLCVIAIVPSLVGSQMLNGSNESYQVTQFLGGTGLLIVISVMLDLVNRIEANLVMRNYSGFMDQGTGGGSGSSNRNKRPVAGSARQRDFEPSKGLPA